jgi:hypothetical protein
MLAAVPPPARILGLAGLLPFWGGVLALIVLDEPGRRAALVAVIAYGAVILTFLGAVHWGLALQVAREVRWERLGWGVAPSLIGWAAMLIDPAPALLLLVLGLGAALAVDLRAGAAALFPAWYVALRIALSIGAIAALLLALVLLPP